MKHVLICFSFLLFAQVHLAASPKQPFTKSANEGTFTENKGQVCDQYHTPRPDVLFSGTANGMVYHLRNNGISYQLSRVDNCKEEINAITKCVKQVPTQTNIYRLDINWLNANTTTEVLVGSPIKGYTNYYLESCPNGALNVRSFETVTYKSIYPGIDLKYYQKDGNLKYDYLVAAGTDYKQIQLEIRGAEKISLNAQGELVFKTPMGNLVDQAPTVIQNKKILKSKWVITNNVLSFEIENLNRSMAFIIDPVVRVWGTYYGDAGTEEGGSCATDALGNVYLAGITVLSSGTTIATSGSHQTSIGGGYDAFVIKFDNAGVRQWGTYYGSSSGEQSAYCATDASGNVYLTGYSLFSNSGTVIATSGSHQNTSGGMADAFLVKFNSSGVRQWGTYYGGVNDDYGKSCTIDASGNVFLAGYTQLSTGTSIATSGSHQQIIGGGGDAFLVKFNSSGVRQWGTYYGGSSQDIGNSCAIDGTGNIYLSGTTFSGTGTVVATGAGHQTLFGGNSDAFLVKFNSAGIRQWGTYYGGTNVDDGFGCTVDASGNVYLAGITQSASGTVIATAIGHQTVFGGSSDAFLVKFDASGIRQWGTYYGGTANEFMSSPGSNCTTDLYGNIYLVGHTQSNSSIASLNSHQSVYGGIVDAFLVKFSSSGTRQWSTYYGGNSGEQGISCAADINANVYLGGWTDLNSSTVIASNGSHQMAFGGNRDLFLAQFAECTPPAPTNTTPISSQNFCANNTTTLLAVGSGTINWYASVTATTVLGTGTVFVTPTLGSGTYTYYAAAFTCVSSLSRTAITLTVNPNPIIAVNSGIICSGQNFTISPSGASTYTIQGGSMVVTPNASTSYTIIGASLSGCVSNTFATASVTVHPAPTISVNSGAICSGAIFTLIPSGASTYTFSSGSNTVNPTNTNSYFVTGTSSLGCVSATPAISTVTVNPLPILVVSTSNSIICVGETALINALGATNYTWSAPISISAANATSITSTPSITTTFTLHGTDDKGCENMATITQSVSECTGEDLQVKNESLSFKVYPNPNNGQFIIEAYSPINIKIVNILGELILSKDLLPNKNEINLSEFEKGVYFVVAVNSNTKLVIQ